MRRYNESIERGQSITYEEVLQKMKERDAQDANREIAPAKPADDAIILDTTGFEFEDSVNAILEIIKNKCGGCI
jgi:cytidylate kinase